MRLRSVFLGALLGTAGLSAVAGAQIGVAWVEFSQQPPSSPLFVVGSIPAIARLVIAVAVLAQSQPQDAAFYAAIQSGPEPLSAEAFAKLEAEAQAQFTAPGPYVPLVKAFGTTTERLWAVIYGEVFLNLIPDDGSREELDSLVFGLYDQAISKQEKGFSISLTRQAEIDPENISVPFGINFEISLLYSFFEPGPEGSRPTPRPGLDPLTLRALTDIRRGQLDLWQEKNFPTTELIRWQRRIVEAGHFDAYNVWLFCAARPEEAAAWLAAHEKEYAAWTEWHRTYRMQLTTPDFQRLHMRAERG